MTPNKILDFKFHFDLLSLLDKTSYEKASCFENYK